MQEFRTGEDRCKTDKTEYFKKEVGLDMCFNGQVRFQKEEHISLNVQIKIRFFRCAY